jgi:transcriptional accessory protein Tex/SPT6
VTRLRNDDDPLYASGVHPQAYPVVRRIIAATKRACSWISPAGPPGVIDRPR